MSREKQRRHSSVTTAFTKTLPLFPEITSNKINTRAFLTSSRGVVIFVDMFGKAFLPVRYDIESNINKIERRFNENQVKYDCLENMLLEEASTGKILITDALLWLRRGLHFLLNFMNLLLRHEDQTLIQCLQAAYKEVLEPYHAWMGKKLFHFLCKCAPSRVDFYQVLALNQNHMQDIIKQQMTLYCSKLEVCVNHLSNFYSQHKLLLAV